MAEHRLAARAVDTVAETRTAGRQLPLPQRSKTQLPWTNLRGDQKALARPRVRSEALVDFRPAGRAQYEERIPRALQRPHECRKSGLEQRIHERRVGRPVRLFLQGAIDPSTTAASSRATPVHAIATPRICVPFQFQVSHISPATGAGDRTGPPNKPQPDPARWRAASRAARIRGSKSILVLLFSSSSRGQSPAFRSTRSASSSNAGPPKTNAVATKPESLCTDSSM